MTEAGGDRAPAPGDVIELRIPSSPVYISVARQAVESVARRLPFGRTELEDVKLAVGEACNNAVKHGCATNGGATVTVRCTIAPSALEIEVRNCHASGQPCPSIDTTPDLNKEGGLGFFLMRQLVDQVEFIWEEECAVVRLIKSVRRAAAA